MTVIKFAEINPANSNNLFDIRQKSVRIKPLKTPDARLLFLPKSSLAGLLAKIDEKAPLILPAILEDKVHFKRYGHNQNSVVPLERIRPCENLKHIFFPQRERVAAFGGKFDKPIGDLIILGAKACDLRALEVYDKVFLDPASIDPFYRERRAKTVIISADCPVPEPTCFCNLIGIDPYVTQGSDLNITPMARGYLVEILSAAGEHFVSEYQALFREATDEEVAARDTSRQEARKALDSINRKAFKRNLSELIGANESSTFWQKPQNGCVECFACLDICPTCYCFLLYEVRENGPDKKERFGRVKIWDACYQASYARVGGGANPRAGFTERFRNRFACKFEYFKKYHDFYACSGCGRCRSGCTAEIDIREVLAQL